MNQNFALESGLNLISESTLYGPGTSETLRQGSANFFAVGILPVAQHVELFGQAGFGFYTARVTNNLNGNYNQYTMTHALLGVGTQFNINPKFGLRVQYESLGTTKANATNPGVDLSRVSIGDVLNFYDPLPRTHQAKHLVTA